MSMRCPNCAQKAKVVDTRQMPGYVRRRYRCDGPAAHRWTTKETVAERTIGQQLKLFDKRGKA